MKSHRDSCENNDRERKQKIFSNFTYDTLFDFPPESYFLIYTSQSYYSFPFFNL